MKRVKVDMSPERLLVTYMITSDRFLREIRPTFRLEYIKTIYARIVAEWILEYWDQYESAPGKNIQAIYETKKHTLQEADEEDVDSIAEFLQRLSADYANSVPTDIVYAVDNAITYLNIRSQELLAEELQSSVRDKDVLRGEQALSNYKRPNAIRGQGTNLLHDSIKVSSAFVEEEELLFTFSGALGKVAGPFNRGDFASFLAPMKRGKTWWLWYVAETAIHVNLKVAFSL